MMRTIVLTCLVFMSLPGLLFSQSSAVVGLWEMDMSVMKPRLEEMIAEQLNGLEDEAQRESMRPAMEKMIENFSSMSIHFKADGNYETKVKASNYGGEESSESQYETKKGVWRYEDGYLYTQEEGKEKEDKVKVKSVVGSSLVLINEDEQGPPQLQEIQMKKVD